MSDRLLAGWKAWMALPLSTRWAAILWFALVIGVTARVTVSKPSSQTVVPIYLTAGERWLNSENLYAAIPGMDLYRNPPLIAASFAPLTYLPAKVAALLVRLVCVALFLTGLWRVRWELLPELTASQAGWFYLLPVVLVLPSFNNGQVNLLVAALGLHGIAAANQSKWWQAALCFSVPGWYKVYPLAMGMLVMLVLPGRFAARFWPLAVAGFVLPFALHDPAYVREQYENYWYYLGLDDRTYTELHRVPRDWTTIPRALFDIIPNPTVTKGVSLTVAALFAGLVLLRRHAPRPEKLLFALILATTWMTAFGPATEVHTYTLLAATAPIILLTTPPGPRWRTAPAWLGYALLAATVLRPMFPNDWHFNVLGPQAAGTLLLLAVALWSRAGYDRHNLRRTEK